MIGLIAAIKRSSDVAASVIRRPLVRVAGESTNTMAESLPSSPLEGKGIEEDHVSAEPFSTFDIIDLIND